MSGQVTVAIVGASGYAGGEFLRLALQHPELRVVQATSERLGGQPVWHAHPNLRGITALKFSGLEALEAADVIVSALPHLELARRIRSILPLAGRFIDLAADFRLASSEAFEQAYGTPHPEPELLGTFVNAVPELHREQLRTAQRIAGAGCIATATILGLAPLVRAGLLAGGDVIAEAKIGSSAAGNRPGPGSHHPDRSGALRTYAPTGHRHEAEIAQALPGPVRVHLTATAVERVRGILVTQHAFVQPGVTDSDVAMAFRTAWKDEPFIRLLLGQRGLHRVPDPRILSGSNWCDIGYALNRDTRRVVIMSAIDNLMKGTAGHAMQALNIAAGWPEATGLGFPGLHP